MVDTMNVYDRSMQQEFLHVDVYDRSMQQEFLHVDRQK